MESSNRYRFLKFQTCLQMSIDNAGSITSPNFDYGRHNYPANARESWLIKSGDPKQHVLVQFTSYFAIEGDYFFIHQFHQLTKSISLIIKSSPNYWYRRQWKLHFRFTEDLRRIKFFCPLARRLLRHPKAALDHFLWLKSICGIFKRFQRRRNWISSSLQRSHVRFTSNIKDLFYRVRMEQSNINPMVRCGEYITADEGVIYSPGYPNLYDVNLVCMWRLTVNVEVNSTHASIFR